MGLLKGLGEADMREMGCVKVKGGCWWVGYGGLDTIEGLKSL